MLHVVRVGSREEAEEATRDAEERGLKLACVSNAGLPMGFLRLTFLPESAFTSRDDQPLGIIREPKI